jgi:hypothetical protein
MAKAKGWKDETLAELQVRFPDAASIHEFRGRKGYSLLLGICLWYRLPLVPVLDWLCSAPYHMDINGEKKGISILMESLKYGSLLRIRTLLDYGADMDFTTNVKIFFTDPFDASSRTVMTVQFTVLDMVMHMVQPDMQKEVLLLLLDRGARKMAYYGLPPYGQEFVGRREPTRQVAITFLGCLRQSALLRRCLDRNTCALIGMQIWEMRFDV